MKNPILLFLMTSLSACGIRTGISPIDDLIAPYQNCGQDYEFVNASSFPLELDAGLFASLSENDCPTNIDTETKTVAPGASYHMGLHIRCRICAPRTHAKITRPAPAGLAYKDLAEDSDASKLPAGLQFEVTDPAKVSRATVTVAAVAAGAHSGHRSEWPIPAAPVPNTAWVLEGKVYVYSPLIASIGASPLIALPASAALSDFGDPLRWQPDGSLFYSSLYAPSTYSLFAEVHGDSTRITCDDGGCTSK